MSTKIKKSRRIQKKEFKKYQAYYEEVMSSFIFNVYENYDNLTDVIDANTKEVRFNPIPVIVEFKVGEEKENARQKILRALDLNNESIRDLSDRITNGDAFEVNEFTPELCLALGIKYGLEKLMEKTIAKEELNG